jgi:O-acetyl-ADP-ribose deacetylase (regulator of RNase III)
VADIGRLPAGEAVITTAGDMPSRHVIHTVGPVWHGGGKNEPALLRNCYVNSLSLAKEKGLRTVAFPSISTGVYGYPVDQAATVAVEAVTGYLREHHPALEEIIFCGFDSATESAYARALKNS